MEFVIGTYQHWVAPSPTLSSQLLLLPPMGLAAWEMEGSRKSEVGTGRGHGLSLFLLLHGNRSN